MVQEIYREDAKTQSVPSKNAIFRAGGVSRLDPRLRGDDGKSLRVFASSRFMPGVL